MAKFVNDKVENIVMKGENAGNHHFLLFQQCFRKASVPRLLKSGTIWIGVNPFPNDKF